MTFDVRQYGRQLGGSLLELDILKSQLRHVDS